MTEPLKNLTFVMPVLNEEDYLELAVASVFEQQVPGEMELVLVLGPSVDSTNQIAQELKSKYGPRLTLVKSPGLTSTSLNLGMQQAKYEVIVRVDAHSELSVGYSSLALDVLNETGAANVGGMMLAKGRSDFQKAVAFGYNNRVGLGGGAFHVGGEAGPAETVYLGVFRKAALEDIGGFSEDWVRGQDWELNQRLRKSGYQVWFDPRLQVGYYPRSSWSSLARQFFKTGLWRGALTRSNPWNSSLRYWIPPLLVLATVLVVPFWVYSVAILLISVRAQGLNLRQRLWLLAVLPTMHYLWGSGFWWGLIRGIPKH